MGGDTLVDRANGQIIDQDHINLLNRVFKGDFVGRDSSGAPTAGQNLGTPTIPWGTARITNLILGGSPIEPGLITALPNRVIAGAIRATSQFPDYLRANGAAASFTVLGTTTNLDYDVNGSTASIAADIVKAALTVAPAANNTCLINDTALTGQDTTRFLGENRTGITVDAMGSELTGKIGEFVALLNQSTSEIMYCRIASATRLDSARRGFFFNSSGTPIAADVLNNNDILQILSLGFIFAEDDGATIDVTYRNPIIGGDTPSSPQTGDYWYDLSVNVWKRYSGVSFDQIDRTFIGAAVIDTANCIGTRPEYFSKAYRDNNTLKIFRETVDIISAESSDFIISIDGQDKKFDFSFFQWTAATDFESGVVRTVSRDYWLYITELGKPIFSDKKPYDNLGFLRGWYHPYESWRSVGQVFNNASDEFELVNKSDESLNTLDGVVFSTGRIILANNSGDPTNDIDFSGGFFTFEDGRNRSIAPAWTKQLDANFVVGNNQGMLDTGAKAINSTYFTFAIENSRTGETDYLASLSLSSPTLPTGFTEKRRIGAILTDASGNIELFLQTDKTFILDNNVSSFFLNGLLAAGSQLITLAVPVGLAVKAIIPFHQFRGTGGAATIAFRISNPDQTDQLAVDATPGPSIFDSLDINQSGNTAHGSAVVECVTNSSAQIRLRPSAAAGIVVSLNTRGWIDFDLE